MTQRRIHLHVGPHKTATTHIQALLKSDAAWTQEREISLYVPPQSRHWTRDFVNYSTAGWWRKPGLASALRKRAPEEALWIISDEHFSRSSPAALWKDYPLIAELAVQTRHLQRLFPDREVQVFLSMRSYDSFFLSNYLEFVRNNSYKDFNLFRDHKRFERYRWTDVVARLASVTDERNITLWRFEDLRQLMSMLIQHLTAESDVQALFDAYPKSVTRPSLSATAMEALREADRVPMEKKQRARLVNDLLNKYPAGERQQKFDPWRAGEKQQLQDRYRDDVESIRRRFPSIQFLSP